MPTALNFPIFSRRISKLLLFVAAALLLGVLFGPDSAFIGGVYQNFAKILTLNGIFLTG